MRFFLPKGVGWHDRYDRIRFPAVAPPVGIAPGGGAGPGKENATGSHSKDATAAVDGMAESQSNAGAGAGVPYGNRVIGDDAIYGPDDVRGKGERRAMGSRMQRPGTHAVIRHHAPSKRDESSIRLDDLPAVGLHLPVVRRSKKSLSLFCCSLLPPSSSRLDCTSFLLLWVDVMPQNVSIATHC
jgi:hypothetical protein